MSKLRVACAIIAASQIVLGGAFLLFPSFMYETMGISIPTQGVNYILGMLSSRLLVYGMIMFIILPDLQRHRLWLDGMLAIQIIDLAAGVFYSVSGAVPLQSAAFPMINAAVFAVALALLRPPVPGRALHA